MTYEELAPPDSLRDTLATVWRFELDASDPPAREHVVPPDGTVSLSIACRGSQVLRVALVGPRTTALRVTVEQGIRYVGLRARPGAGHLLIGQPVTALRDRVCLLDDIAPDRAAQIRTVGGVPEAADEADAALADTIARFSAVVTSWRQAGPAPDPIVLAMVDQIVSSRGQATIQAVCVGVGLGYRQALRRFQQAVGLSPKEMARLVRIRAACLEAIAPAASWASVSATTGFADQSHLSREFTETFGWPPQLVREYLRRIEHVNVRVG